MSTIQVTNIKHASSNTNSIELDSGGAVTLPKVNSINGGPLAGFRNVIINGGMEIAQRGTSGTSGYLIDRWTTNNTSAQSQSSDAPAEFLNSLEFTSNTATFPYFEQFLERANSYHLAGQTCTLSFWAKSVSGSSSLYFEIYRADANDNFGTVTFETAATLATSPSTSWVKYTATFTLSSSATTGIIFRIVRDNASAASTRITGVQLEAGPVATPFERRPIGTELALCQRYYERYDASQNERVNLSTTANDTSTTTRGAIRWQTTKRNIPTVSISGNWRTLGANQGAATTLSFSEISIYGAQVMGTASYTQGQANLIQSDDNNNGIVQISAEF
jgi:hypothetical protein